jgi:hypothetical protein
MRIHLKNYVEQLLFPNRRKPTALAIIQTLLFPISALNDSFQKYRKETLGNISATSQYLSLVYHIGIITEKPMHKISIYGNGGNSYTVNIPNPVSGKDEERVKKHLERYRLSGTNFQINRYDSL